MNGLSNVSIIKRNGALGGIPVSNDGESLLIISSANIGATPQTYSSFDDFVNDYPILQNFDDQNKTIFTYHVRRYFEQTSQKLHLMIVSGLIHNSSLFDTSSPEYTSVKNYIVSQNGAIKLVAVALNPSYIPILSNGVEDTLVNGIAKAQALVNNLANDGYYINILLEGRGVDISSNTLINLRGINAPNVSVIAFRDANYSASRMLYYFAAGFIETHPNNYTEIGMALGVLANRSVEENIGEVAKGALPAMGSVAIGTTLIKNISKTKLNELADKGFIFARQHVGLTGFYLSDDPTCTVITDDFAWITRNRVINKACIITRRVFTQKLLGKVLTDPDTGKLSTITIKSYEADIENAINNEMVTLGQCQAVDAIIDPNQDVLTTNSIEIQLRILPFGHARYITVKVGFTKVI
jgi:hypothetical protein